MFRLVPLIALIATPLIAQDAALDAPPARPERPAVDAAAQSAFDDWASAFRGRALVQGVPRDTVDDVLAAAELLPDVMRADRDRRTAQRAVWSYLDAAVTEDRIDAGRKTLTDEARILTAIESRYGIEPAILVAIWGIETDFGAARGEDALTSILATLSQGAGRAPAFEAQMIAALKLIESGATDPAAMTGAPDGTTGHTGLLPTTLIVHAVDFDGDGRSDVWGDSPADALASTAAYLSSFGWVTGQPWGVEVSLPDGFDYALARRTETRLPSDWATLGVTGVDGAEIEDFGEASILLPAGAAGAAFFVFPNYQILERYDATDAWPLAVGLLADRLNGGDALSADWPRDDRVLTDDELREMQGLLTDAGFDTFGIDGRVGPLTVAAIRAFQSDRGMVPDGYASLRVLEALRDS